MYLQRRMNTRRTGDHQQQEHRSFPFYAISNWQKDGLE